MQTGNDIDLNYNYTRVYCIDLITTNLTNASHTSKKERKISVNRFYANNPISIHYYASREAAELDTRTEPFPFFLCVVAHIL